MCAKFHENPRETVEVAIWKKFDDVNTDRLNHSHCKVCWLQASSRAYKKFNNMFIYIFSNSSSVQKRLFSATWFL